MRSPAQNRGGGCGSVPLKLAGQGAFTPKKAVSLDRFQRQKKVRYSKTKDFVVSWPKRGRRPHGLAGLGILGRSTRSQF
jgi:hypothetical protein